MGISSTAGGGATGRGGGTTGAAGGGIGEAAGDAGVAPLAKSSKTDFMKFTLTGFIVTSVIGLYGKFEVISPISVTRLKGHDMRKSDASGFFL